MLALVLASLVGINISDPYIRPEAEGSGQERLGVVMQ